MRLIGPDGAVGTQLNSFMLISTTSFYHKMGETQCFYAEDQALFKEAVEKLSIKMICCLDFDMIKKLIKFRYNLKTHGKKDYRRKKIAEIAVAGFH